VSASTITDIYYIVRNLKKSKEIALASLKNLLTMVDVAAVTDNEIRQAIRLDWGDFEDAVQYAVGETIAVDYIVTRNKSDFSSAVLPVVSPDDFLALLT
jgi:predicted nucleic acid-binding protein